MKYRASENFLFHFLKKRQTSHPQAFVSLSMACASSCPTHQNHSINQDTKPLNQEPERDPLFF